MNRCVVCDRSLYRGIRRHVLTQRFFESRRDFAERIVQNLQPLQEIAFDGSRSICHLCWHRIDHTLRPDPEPPAPLIREAGAAITVSGFTRAANTSRRCMMENCGNMQLRQMPNSIKFTSKVVKCEETKEPIVDYGKLTNFEGYQITLENTILFPAGGGQPHDVGWLNGTEVLQVLRKGDEALHFTKEPIDIGTEVAQKINWVRRFDHMQQHSGQHLLSAILETEHNLPTTSWWLGAEECYVELDSTKVSSKTTQAAEDRCNSLIRDALPVNVKFCKANEPALDEAHTRGLPKDCMDTIRIICIDNIDENMCCGTHVSNLSHLQVIKLLGTEPGKKGKTNLKFLVGNRVTKTFQTMLDRERALTGLLKNEASKHEELVQKLQKNLKISNKNLQNVLLELAQLEVERVKNMQPQPRYVFMYKKEATPEFNRAICKGLEGEGLFLFLVSEEQDKPKEGQIIIQGPKEHCNAMGQQLTELLKGKGAFKNGKFQGKAGDLGGINRCKKLIEEYFSKSE